MLSLFSVYVDRRTCIAHAQRSEVDSWEPCLLPPGVKLGPSVRWQVPLPARPSQVTHSEGLPSSARGPHRVELQCRLELQRSGNWGRRISHLRPVGSVVIPCPKACFHLWSSECDLRWTKLLSPGSHTGRALRQFLLFCQSARHSGTPC